MSDEIPEIWFKTPCRCGHPRDQHSLMVRACLASNTVPGSGICTCTWFQDANDTRIDYQVEASAMPVPEVRTNSDVAPAEVEPVVVAAKPVDPECDRDGSSTWCWKHERSCFK